MSHSDLHFMRHALRLARRGRGYVEPNPMVGAVVVRDGHIVGEGWHQRHGGPHAELNAIADAADKTQGATLYVTLEPCCHHGKTPPCTDAVRNAGFARVVAAMVDPNPQVSGQGLAALEKAGIAVQIGPLTHRAMVLNEPFIKRQVTALPYVIAKWAATLDGAIATATGHSQWISNPRSRRVVHHLRSRVDAIIVGIGTAIADDPMLTARDVTVRRLARRVVLDPHLKLPADSALVRTADRVPLIVAASEEVLAADPPQARALRSKSVELLPLPPLTASTDEPHARLDLRPLLAHLAEAHNATNVLLEGGAGTLGSFFEQGHVDEIFAFIAPKLIGDGRHLPPLRSRRQIDQINQAQSLELRRVRRLDDDLLLRYRVVSP
ncbi:MAG: bifunctional diaminohydroxyphosphoribosylaminopyrimidine deaminase/5-amino-6-(5-phosphoribosylamino)uracil reductase RibD [Phycisphaeraceae bacterium]